MGLRERHTSSGFLSGWSFKESFRYAFRMSAYNIKDPAEAVSWHMETVLL
jgi:hypothetical protein